MPFDLALKAELESERWQLVRAERDIAAGEQRIIDQELMIEAFQRDGHNTGIAELVLETLRSTLLEWRRHEVLIRARIHYLEGKCGGAPADDLSGRRSHGQVGPADDLG
jgi:hypothetical protein